MTDAAEARLTVDLDALAANHARLRATAVGAEVAPVVKADGYGLGAGEVSRRLWAEGARRFFVARVGEGEAVRAALGPGRAAQILVLDGAPPGALPRLDAAELTPVLNSLEQARAARAFAGGRGARLQAALHIDTGLNRLGVRPEEAEGLRGAPGLELVLVMSHLACGQDAGHPMNLTQLERFREAAALFPDAPRSLANSAGVFLGEAYHFEVVRPGVTLYGGGPFEAEDPRFGAVARFEAPVLQVRTVPAGESVGYDATFTAARPTRAAIVAAGHADGVLRSGSGRLKVWLGGAKRPVLGSVSMDLVAVDAGDSDIKAGDMAEIIGPNASVDAAAAAAGTISYEILVRISRRARRSYMGSPG